MVIMNKGEAFNVTKEEEPLKIKDLVEKYVHPRILHSLRKYF
jgi:hypothetical protein